MPAVAVSGAELPRNEPFRYGRFEARMQLAAGDGIVSTFFLWKDGSERPDVFWNEIDIEKLAADCRGYSSNALYGLPESNHTLDIVSSDDLCAGYHTHVVEWTPDHLAWLLDGTEVRRITGADALAFEQNVASPRKRGAFSPELVAITADLARLAPSRRCRIMAWAAARGWAGLQSSVLSTGAAAPRSAVKDV